MHECGQCVSIRFFRLQDASDNAPPFASSGNRNAIFGAFDKRGARGYRNSRAKARLSFAFEKDYSLVELPYGVKTADVECLLWNLHGPPVSIEYTDC